MTNSSKILFNTFSLYCKLIITTIASLYLTRIVLSSLGVDDFGLYNLIAGVISLLSFLNVSLMSSTQRFMSISIGAKNYDDVRSVFSSSMILHLLLGFVLLVILEILGLFLFDGFLNIPVNRIEAVKIVYQIMILSMFITIVGAPYNAAINAFEDIWYIAITDVLTAVFKLGLIWIFMIKNVDPLLIYAIWMLLATIINLFVKLLWCLFKYRKICHVNFSIKEKLPIIKDLSSFVGWNTLGSIAVLGRNQGVAVVLNVFFTTSINAVYGIANQVSSQLVYFSHMITTAMTPQITKSKGENDIGRLLYLSVFTSKFTYFISVLFSIPLIIEIDFVLKLWLEDVPQYTNFYCTATILIFMIMQLYPGLNRAIQADGRIKQYKIWTSVLIILPIIIGAILFKFNFSHYIIMYLMIVAQISVMIMTIHICKKLLNLDIKSYYSFVLKAILISIFTYLLCCTIKHVFVFTNEYAEFILVLLISTVVLSILFYNIILNRDEKQTIVKQLKKIRKWH